MAFIQLFDYYGLYKQPSISLCNPNKDELVELGAIYNTNLILRFNSLSTFSFICPSQTDMGETVSYFDLLEYRRLVYIKDICYFMITDIKESNDGIKDIKTVTCQSLEVELVNKKISKFKGTYKLYDAISPSTTLLGTLITYCPGWTIGTVDITVGVLYRTFDVSDNNIYNFLMTDCESTYQCVFTFDTMNKQINCYSTTTATTSTDIYMDYDNLLLNMDLKQITSEVCTAMNVYGGGDLDIRTVNPLGTDTIYNFSYFMSTDWMSQSLIDALEAWDIKVNDAQIEYADLLTTLKDANDLLVTKQGELVTLQNDLLALEGVQAVRAQQGISFTNSYTDSYGVYWSSLLLAISSKQTQITAKIADVALTQANVTYISNQLLLINQSLGFGNTDNFTLAQYNELGSFIIGNTYTNTNFIKTDIMTNSEIQDISQELYNQAVNVLAKVSQPRYEFSVDSVNFVFLQEYQTFIDQLVLGAITTLEINNNLLAYPVLLELNLTYDNPTDFKITFGNRLRLDNNDFEFSDLFGDPNKSAITQGFNSEQWNDWYNNSKDDVTTFIDSSLNASNNNVITSVNQEFVINQNGLKGRYLDPITSTYSLEQLWMNNNMLAFTDNNWNSAKLALGKITTPTGGTAYGLVADVICGRLLAGNQLTITNSGNNFTLDSSGATLTNASFTLNTSSGNSRIYLNATDGIKIQGLTYGSWTDKFYVDLAGNVNFAGNLAGATGTFSGTLEAYIGHIGTWTIGDSGLYDSSSGNHIYPTDIKLGALSIVNSTAIFDGTIYADKLVGQINTPQIADGAVTATKISELTADMITTGTMSCDRLYGGTISGYYGASMIFGYQTNFPVKITGATYVAAPLQATSLSADYFFDNGDMDITGKISWATNTKIWGNSSSLALIGTSDIQVRSGVTNNLLYLTSSNSYLYGNNISLVSYGSTNIYAASRIYIQATIDFGNRAIYTDGGQAITHSCDLRNTGGGGTHLGWYNGILVSWYDF